MTDESRLNLDVKWPEPVYGDGIKPSDLQAGFEVTAELRVPLDHYELLVGQGTIQPGAGGPYTITYAWTEGDHDPFYDQPPRGLRRALAWVYACAQHAWRENLGLTRPEVRWKVTYYNVRLSVDIV